MRVDLQGSSVEFKPRESVVSKIEASLQPGFEPVQPRYAATVMLVRDSKPFQTECRIESDHFPSDFPTGQELEVFMLRRVKTMEFVPDAVVFPGGRVDERDSNPNLPWCGPTPAQWAELMGCTEEVARRVVVAAAREVFEECGVLLAGPDEHSVVQDLSDPTWKENRTALENHEIAFADFLILHGLVLRTDLLGLISIFCSRVSSSLVACSIAPALSRKRESDITIYMPASRARAPIPINTGIINTHLPFICRYYKLFRRRPPFA